MTIVKREYSFFAAAGFFIFLLFLLPVSASASQAYFYERLVPSVVVLHTVERGWNAEESDKKITAMGIGSGVIISDDGLVLTAAHVVQVADVVEVKFSDGSRASAKVKYSSPRTDLALIKIDLPEGKEVSPAAMGNSDALSVGDQLFVIGSPHGFEFTLTSGLLSNKMKTGVLGDGGQPLEVLLTDAGIDVGNSGGPVFNESGEVVGIVSQFFSSEVSTSVLGAAVSMNSVKDELLEKRPIWTGIELYLLPDKMGKALNSPTGSGFLVQRVAKGSPGAQAGLKGGTIKISETGYNIRIGGDIIFEVNGVSVSNDPEHLKKLSDSILGKKQVTIKILRDGNVETIKINVAK